MLPAVTNNEDADGAYDGSLEDTTVVQKSGEKANRGKGDDLASSVADQFLKRLRHHLHLLANFVTRVLEAKNLMQLVIGDPEASFDDFGMRKIVLAATERGTLAGLDSKSGKMLWRLVLEMGARVSHLFVQRSPLHFGFESRCAAVIKSESSSKLLIFDPTNGDILEQRVLDSAFSQAILLHHTTEEHLRPLLLLHGQNGKVTMEPADALKSYLPGVADKTYLMTIDNGLVQGQKLVQLSEGSYGLLPIWSLNVAKTEVAVVAAKSSEETVHSHGRVMADRSVLFKYVNPNLALIIAEGKDSSNKGFINVYLTDMVTGRVVFSANHKRVTGPYHVVHSENWAVYTYYNEKARRGELTSIELFEGATQANSTVFSSLLPPTAPLSPLVERQSFILGGMTTHVAATAATVTDKSITAKHVLLATSAGSVYDVPRVFLDPRRPNFNTPPEKREPGLPPYVPELQLPPETVLNYNQTVSSPRGIATAPTGLESTAVVFVYGLDLYCTRIAPSKGFDLLKDDFDYYVISGVLAALVAAAYATRKLAQRKNLKAAWR